MGNLNVEWVYWDEMQEYAYRENQLKTRPSTRMKPRLMRVGDQWCALFGGNIQDGVVGFGSSPEKAYEDFDVNWAKEIPSTEPFTKAV